MIAAETSFTLPDLAIVGSLVDAHETTREESAVQQLIWHLADVCTESNRQTLLSKLVTESYNLVGFGPMISALEGL
jgi:hypothetical protein